MHAPLLIRRELNCVTGRPYHQHSHGIGSEDHIFLGAEDQGFEKEFSQELIVGSPSLFASLIVVESKVFRFVFNNE